MTDLPPSCQNGSDLSSTTPTAQGVDAAVSNPGSVGQDTAVVLRTHDDVVALIIAQAIATFDFLSPDRQLELAATLILQWADEKHQQTFSRLIEGGDIYNPHAYVSRSLWRVYHDRQIERPRRKTLQLDPIDEPIREPSYRDKYEHTQDIQNFVEKAMTVLQREDSLVFQWLCIQYTNGLSKEKAAGQLDRQDGTLRQRLKKAIDNNPELRALREDFLGSNSLIG